MRAFAAGMGTVPIDVLVLNADILAEPLSRTADGRFESQPGTHFVGQAAPIDLLLPQVRDRVVSLSSDVHGGWGGGRSYGTASSRTTSTTSTAATTGGPPRAE